MAVEGLHHITAITGDAPANVDFYARVLGLRLVKKTVNFDAPEVYHLYYGDEAGTPGALLTYFEFPGAVRGRPGDGMVHTIQWRVAGAAALDWWQERLAAEGVASERDGDGLRFADPEGMAIEFLAGPVDDAPLTARAAGIPAEHALQGFAGVRAYASDPGRSAPLLQTLGFARARPGDDTVWIARGGERHGVLTYDPPPPERGRESGGSVHHIAWSLADDAELEAYRDRAGRAGARATPIIDRQYFHSVYFREPSGVLFELASRDIGFAVDEDPAHLGEALQLPPQYEAHRAILEQRLTPLVNPRTEVRA